MIPFLPNILTWKIINSHFLPVLISTGLSGSPTTRGRHSYLVLAMTQSNIKSCVTHTRTQNCPRDSYSVRVNIQRFSGKRDAESHSCSILHITWSTLHEDAGKRNLAEGNTRGTRRPPRKHTPDTNSPSGTGWPGPAPGATG